MDKRAKREELLGDLQDIEHLLDQPHTPGFVPTLSDIVSSGDSLDDSNIPTLEDLAQHDFELPSLDTTSDAGIEIPMLDDVIDSQTNKNNQPDLLHALDVPPRNNQAVSPPVAEPVSITPASRPSTPTENPFLPEAILKKLAMERHAAETAAANAMETLKPNHAIAIKADNDALRHEIEASLNRIVKDVLNEYLPILKQEIEHRLEKTKQDLLK